MADIVIFYELPERELNNANLLKAEFEKRGYSVDILITGNLFFQENINRNY